MKVGLQAFFSHVQDVSDEQLQAIWGKILAGQLQVRGRTSLRTMAILRNMNRTDAERFRQIASLSIRSFILNDSEINDKYTRRLSSFPEHRDFLQLMACGLVHGMVTGSGTQRHFRLRQAFEYGWRCFLDQDDDKFILAHSGKAEKCYTAYHLTDEGDELRACIGAVVDESYLDILCDYFQVEHQALFARCQRHPKGWTFPIGPLASVQRPGPVPPIARVEHEPPTESR